MYNKTPSAARQCQDAAALALADIQLQHVRPLLQGTCAGAPGGMRGCVRVLAAPPSPAHRTAPCAWPPGPTLRCTAAVTSARGTLAVATALTLCSGRAWAFVAIPSLSPPTRCSTWMPPYASPSRTRHCPLQQRNASAFTTHFARAPSAVQGHAYRWHVPGGSPDARAGGASLSGHVAGYAARGICRPGPAGEN